MACAANQESYSCVDESCVNEREQARVKMEQAQADIESYNAVVSNIKDIQADISMCDTKLSCTFDKASAGVTTDNPSLFSGINNYRTELAKENDTLESTLNDISTAIDELNATISECEGIIAACGECMTTCCR